MHEARSHHISLRNPGPAADTELRDQFSSVSESAGDTAWMPSGSPAPKTISEATIDRPAAAGFNGRCKLNERRVATSVRLEDQVVEEAIG